MLARRYVRWTSGMLIVSGLCVGSEEGKKQKVPFILLPWQVQRPSFSAGEFEAVTRRILHPMFLHGP